MPVRLFACTPSKLATFTDCPRRYHFTYLQRPILPKGHPWAHNSLGAAVHNALRSWWELPPARRTPEAAGALLDAGWLTDGFRDPAQSDRWRTRAREWVVGYVAGLDPADEPPGAERTVAATTARLALSGRVDRIDDRDGELVIVDYKTGRTPPNSTDARGSQALAFYVLGARRTLHRPCSRVELHHLPSGTVAAFEHTEESLARHVGRAEDTAEDIIAAQQLDTAEAFGPQPGRLCGWCDFRRHCPEGQAAGPEKLGWAALDEPA